MTTLVKRWCSPSSGALIGAVALALGPLIGWAAANEQWFLFVLLVGVALAPVVIRWPVVSTLGLYAFLIPFDSVAGLAGGATLTRLIGMAAGGTLLVTGLMEGRLVRPPRGALLWGVFVMWGALTAAWALDPGLVMSRVRMALSLFVLYLVAVSFRVSQKEFNLVAALTVAGGVAAAAAAYLVGVNDPDAGGRGTLSLGDAAANANAFAVSLLIPAALAMGGFLRARSMSLKIGAVAAIAVIGCGIYVTVSRAALLALCVLVMFLAYRAGIRWQLMVVPLVLLALLGTMSDAFFDRVASPFTGEDATGAGRTGIWDVGLSALEEFWLFGAGLSNFPRAYALYTPIAPGDFARVAHNVYLGTWVELGIIGLVCLLAAVGAHLLAAWKFPRRSEDRVLLYATEAGCVALLAFVFFGDRLWMKGFWMAWTLLAWATRLAGEQQPAQEEAARASSWPEADRRGSRPSH